MVMISLGGVTIVYVLDMVYALGEKWLGKTFFFEGKKVWVFTIIKIDFLPE